MDSRTDEGTSSVPTFARASATSSAPTSGERLESSAWVTRPILRPHSPSLRLRMRRPASRRPLFRRSPSRTPSLAPNTPPRRLAPRAQRSIAARCRGARGCGPTDDARGWRCFRASGAGRSCQNGNRMRDEISGRSRPLSSPPPPWDHLRSALALGDPAIDARLTRSDFAFSRQPKPPSCGTISHDRCLVTCDRTLAPVVTAW